ncbi:MAG: hypothetical protein HY611_03010 [Elusimicrobia bacterium]|nr:hypothetical protein [Elusimicrobiota bacterium]
MPWLLGRLFAEKDQPKPRFAFQGCVNWMRALAIYCDAGHISRQACATFFAPTIRRAVNKEMDTLAYEFLVMSAHHAAATKSLAAANGNTYNGCRAAIVSWYYSVYYAAKAMIAAAGGSDPQTHAKAARIWQADIASRGLAMYPFDLRVVNLTTQNVEASIAALRNGNPHDVNTRPVSNDQAHGALCSYLRGTCEYRQWEIEEDVRKSSDFKALGKSDFRSKDARQLRDQAFGKESVNFLFQAFRYRGKANYRDAIYLSYGDNNDATLKVFGDDLGFVSSAFVLMAAHFVARRVEAGTWDQFAEDVHANARFDLPFEFRGI